MTDVLIQVDEKFDKFINKARMNGKKQLLFSSILLIVMGFMLYRKDEEEQQSSMKYKNHQITSSIHYSKIIQ